MYHFLHAGFFTPAVMWTIVGGRYYICINNSFEARYNLWDYLMWEHIMEERGER
jgi:hypothetical protein